MAFASDKGRQGAAGVSTGGYSIDNSLRFNDDDTAYLSRTPATAGNRKTWTWSAWVKLSGAISGNTALFVGGSSGSNFCSIALDGNSNISLFWYVSSSVVANVTTSAKLRDPSAWYHLQIAVDTTQATASNRMIVYLNGIQQTSFVATTYPSQNYDGLINNTNAHYLGQFGSAGYNYFDGYLAEVNFVDGQALTPSDFGETDEDYGHWKPIAYAGTYGTNGFYLNFKGDDSLVSATGGTSIYTVGDYKVHQFDSDATLSITSVAGVGVIDILAVAGGGAGNVSFGAGGGAGGLILTQSYSVSSGDSFSMVVGAGGSGSSKTNGSNSTVTIDTVQIINAVGGGLGGGEAPSVNGSAGGSGGGGGYAGGSGGAGTSGQGNAGGSGTGTYTMGGGGGYGSTGGSGDGSVSGNGGTGYDASTLFGTSIPNSGLIAGGGGGGAGNGKTRGTGSYGGGDGEDDSNSASTPIQNTGGGGGGRGSSTTATGANGVILVRYKFQ